LQRRLSLDVVGVVLVLEHESAAAHDLTLRVTQFSSRDINRECVRPDPAR
jgi:hypothetical protein